MEAEIRLAMVPASMARTPSLAKSLRRSGTRCADAADLHADGAEVGESAEGKGGDGEGAG
jgi:hypothetical protein